MSRTLGAFNCLDCKVQMQSAGLVVSLKRGTIVSVDVRCDEKTLAALEKDSALKELVAEVEAMGRGPATQLLLEHVFSAKHSKPETIPKVLLSPDVSGSLTRLISPGLALREIPPAIFNIRTLKTLHMSRNEIRYVSPRLENFTSLEELELSCNDIAFFPFARIMASCVGLKVLKLEDNARMSKFVMDRFADSDIKRFLEIGSKNMQGHEAALFLWTARVKSNCLDFLPKEVVRLIMGWCHVESGVRCDQCEEMSVRLCRSCKRSYFCRKSSCYKKHLKECDRMFASKLAEYQNSYILYNNEEDQVW